MRRKGGPAGRTRQGVNTRWISAVLAVLAISATACGGDSTESAPEETEPENTTTTTEVAITTSSLEAIPGPCDDPADLTASFRGVTEDVIRVGVVTPDNEYMNALALGNGATNVDGAYAASLEVINDDGGVCGRTLEITNLTYIPIGSVDAEAACVELTQDVGVFVVVGELGSALRCYTELSQTAVIAPWGMADEAVEATWAPFAQVIMAAEPWSTAWAETLVDEAVLDGHKVGVVGAEDVDPYRFQRVVDALREVGVDPVEGLIPENNNDLVANIRSAQVISEKFRVEGVTLIVNTIGLAVGLTFGWDSDLADVLHPIINSRQMRDADVDFAVADGAYSVSDSDMSTLRRPEMADDPDIAACVDNIEARTGEEISYALDAERTILYWALQSCSIAAILERALLNAGPNLTNETFQDGLEAIGDIDLPGWPGSHLGPGDMDASSRQFLVRFDAALGAWVEVP